MSQSEEFPKFFREEVVLETVELTEVNGLEGINGFGEGPSFTANWLDDDNNVVANKTASYKTVFQLGNGDLIGNIQETIKFVDGPLKGDEISTEGFLIANLAGAGGIISYPVVSGTGIFEDIRVVEDITGGIPFIFDITLQKLEEVDGNRFNDNINGKKASEFIAGNNGNDTIDGGQGNDIIEGSRGGDIIGGGAGNDILAADRINRFQDFDGSTSKLKSGNGNDTIYGGSKDDLIGGGNDNDLLFGKSGDDLIRGGNGFDLLQGGVGNDTLRGQGSIDVADYSDLTFDGVSNVVAGVDVNLRRNQAQHSSDNNALTWTDTLTTIENVTGTSRNDRLIGDSNDNVLNGLAEVGRDDHQTEFIGLDGEHYKVTGDVVEYDGDRADFEFGESQLPYFGGITVTGDKIGSDILLGIEFIKFNDGLVATDSINQ